jgi:CRP/FNR family transcriptional regulator, anaerobic regulatory protein
MTQSQGNVFELSAHRRSCGNCALTPLCLAAGLDSTTLDQLDNLVEYRPPLAPGETLFHRGECMRTVYLVRSGALKSIAEHEDGSYQVLGFHLAGELLGLDGFFSGRHTCRVEALQRSRVCPLPWDALQLLAQQLPSVQHQLMTAIGHETLADHRHLAMMGCPAPRRLAMFLRDLSERQARLRLDPSELRLAMPREDIANFLGMAEETVCRQFTRMNAEGILSVRRRTVQILDHERLGGVCHGQPRPAVAASG